MNKQAKEPDLRPMCQSFNRGKNNHKVPCPERGVACTVSGDFTALTKFLCNKHIGETRERGWKVRYQLEGDEPKPSADQVL